MVLHRGHQLYMGYHIRGHQCGIKSRVTNYMWYHVGVTNYMVVL